MAVWVKEANLKGPRGERGQAGPSGPQGLAGANGVPTDAAVAANMRVPSETRAAMKGSIDETIQASETLAVRASSAVQRRGLDQKCVLGFRDGQFFSKGAKVSPRVAATSVPDGVIRADRALEVNSAYTELAPNTAFTGANPSTNTLPSGYAWYFSQGKTVTAASTGSFTFQVSQWDGSTSGVGKVNGGGVAFTVAAPGGDVSASFNPSIRLIGNVPAGHEVWLIVAWRDTSTGGLSNQVGGGFGTTPLSSLDTDQGSRVNVAMTDPQASRQLVWYLAKPSNQDMTGITVEVTLSSLSVARTSQVGTDRVLQRGFMSHTGATSVAVPGKDVTLRLPGYVEGGSNSGRYVLRAITSDGVSVARSVTVLGSNGVSLLSALGASGARIRSLWVLDPADDDPLDMETLHAPDFQSPVWNTRSDVDAQGNRLTLFSPRLTSVAIRRPLSLNGRAADADNPATGIQVAANYDGVTRTRVAPGEVSPSDAPTSSPAAPKVRAELYAMESFPYGQSFGWGGWLRVESIPKMAPLPTQSYVVQQCRYRPPATDPGVGPELSLAAYSPPEEGLWGLHVRAVTDGGPTGTPGSNRVQTLMHLDGTQHRPYPVGADVYVAYQATFNAAGGRLQVWVNETGLPGDQILVVDYTGPLGYSDISTYAVRFGTYGAGNPWPGVLQTLHQGPAYGIGVNAEALASFPPPRLGIFRG